MSISRIKALSLLMRTRNIVKPSINRLSVRHGHHGEYFYRRSPDPCPKLDKKSDIINALIWGWIIYHFINNYEELIAEFEIPDPLLWTDEELGIPPDNE